MADRVEKLLDLLYENPEMAAEDVLGVVDVSESDLQAERSVAAVEGVLAEHQELFRSFERTVPGSENDREGRDINVALVRSESRPDFHEFSIEVKSSPVGVAYFRNNLKKGTTIRVRQERVKALGLEAAMDEYLYERRIIVVDASREDLEADLLRQFGLLREYWKKKHFSKK